MFAIYCSGGGFIQAALGSVGSELFIYGQGKHAALPIPKSVAAQVLRRVRSHGVPCWLVDYAALHLNLSHGQAPTAQDCLGIQQLVRSIVELAHNPLGCNSNAAGEAGSFLGLVTANLQWLFEQEFFGLQAAPLLLGSTPLEQSAQRQADELFTRFLQIRGQVPTALLAAAKTPAGSKEVAA